MATGDHNGPTYYVQPPVTGGPELVFRPPDLMQESIVTIFNGLNFTNLEEASTQLKELIGRHYWYWPWVTQYLVMHRATIQPNYHSMYSRFLDYIAIPDLDDTVLQETYRNIRLFLQCVKNPRKLEHIFRLTNLGHWLGLITLEKNKPILFDDLDVKSLLVESFDNGVRDLGYVIPFVTTLMESCTRSMIFKPPSPWTMGILSLLAELRPERKLKLPMKFYIEVLFGMLDLDINSFTPSRILRGQFGNRTYRTQLAIEMSQEQFEQYFHSCMSVSSRIVLEAPVPLFDDSPAWAFEEVNPFGPLLARATEEADVRASISQEELPLLIPEEDVPSPSVPTAEEGEFEWFVDVQSGMRFRQMEEAEWRQIAEQENNQWFPNPEQPQSHLVQNAKEETSHYPAEEQPELELSPNDEEQWPQLTDEEPEVDWRQIIGQGGMQWFPNPEQAAVSLVSAAEEQDKPDYPTEEQPEQDFSTNADEEEQWLQLTDEEPEVDWRQILGQGCMLWFPNPEQPAVHLAPTAEEEVMPDNPTEQPAAHLVPTIPTAEEQVMPDHPTDQPAVHLVPTADEQVMPDHLTDQPAVPLVPTAEAGRSSYATENERWTRMTNEEAEEEWRQIGKRQRAQYRRILEQSCVVFPDDPEEEELLWRRIDEEGEAEFHAILVREGVRN